MMESQKLTRFLARAAYKLFRVKLYSTKDVADAVLTVFNPTINTKYDKAFNAAYYQHLHNENNNFKHNNWLIDDIDIITKAKPKTITELACGNGMFSRVVASRCTTVYAIDWAESPEFKDMPGNVFYMKKNIVTDELPKSDLICSGDFLEHLPTGVLGDTIRKIVNAAPFGYHKIACYNDGHSHLSILPAWQWLKYFNDIDSQYKITNLDFRRSQLNQPVVVISNF